MLTRLIATGLLGAVLSLGLTAAAVPQGDEQPEIRFARGAIDSTIRGAVIRGDRDIYPISAGADQTMTVRIESLEDNAVFQIFPPGATYHRDDDNVWTFRGAALRGSDGDTRDWTGRLSRGGQYLIVVGGTRGNATYSLNVRIE